MRQLNSIIDVGGLNVVQYRLRILGYFRGSAAGESGRYGYGALALLIWALSMAALALGKGLLAALRWFALPSMLFLAVIVLLFDLKEMSVQAVNFVFGLTYNGVSLPSDWFVLTASLPLVILELVYEGLWKKRDARIERSRITIPAEPQN